MIQPKICRPGPTGLWAGYAPGCADGKRSLGGVYTFTRLNGKEMSSYYMIDSYVRMFLLHICRPMLLHRMTLVSFRMFRKNLGNLGELFVQISLPPAGKKLPVRL